MNVVIFWINYLESGNHPLVMFIICLVISLLILVCTKTIYDRTNFLIQNRICMLGNFVGSVSTVFHVIWRTRASAIVALIFNIMAMSAVAMSWISQMAKSQLIIMSINFIVNMHTIFKKLAGLYFKNLFVKQDEYKNSLTVIIVVQMFYIIFSFLAETDESYIFLASKREKKPFFKKIGSAMVKQLRENRISLKDIIMDTYHFRPEASPSTQVTRDE